MRTEWLRQDALAAGRAADAAGFNDDPAGVGAWSADISLCEERIGRELTAFEAARWLADFRKGLRDEPT